MRFGKPSFAHPTVGFRLLIRAAGFTPPAISVLMVNQPLYGPSDIGLTHVFTHRVKTTQHMARPVDVIHSPTAVPGAARLLILTDKADGALDDSMRSRKADET